MAIRALNWLIDSFPQFNILVFCRLQISNPSNALPMLLLELFLGALHCHYQELFVFHGVQCKIYTNGSLERLIFWSSLQSPLLLPAIILFYSLRPRMDSRGLCAPLCLFFEGSWLIFDLGLYCLFVLHIGLPLPLLFGVISPNFPCPWILLLLFCGELLKWYTILTSGVWFIVFMAKDGAT